MTKFKITYMVDPGDGITTTDTLLSNSDNMVEILNAWQMLKPFYIVKCEVIQEKKDEV